MNSTDALIKETDAVREKVESLKKPPASQQENKIYSELFTKVLLVEDTLSVGQMIMLQLKRKMKTVEIIWVKNIPEAYKVLNIEASIKENGQIEVGSLTNKHDSSIGLAIVDHNLVRNPQIDNSITDLGSKFIENVRKFKEYDPMFIVSNTTEEPLEGEKYEVAIKKLGANKYFPKTFSGNDASLYDEILQHQKQHGKIIREEVTETPRFDLTLAALCTQASPGAAIKRGSHTLENENEDEGNKKQRKT